MSYDPGLVERIADSLLQLGERGVRQKNVFSGRGFLIGKKAFAIAWGEGVIVKVPPEEYASLRERSGVEPFAPDGEHPMGTWLLVSADVVADDPELADWLRLGLEAVRRSR